MKLKISLGRDELKSFCFAHIEKMALAFIVLICAGLVAMGYQKPKTNMTPEEMNKRATAADKHIDRTLWADVQQKRVKVIDFQAKANKVTQPIQPASYSFGAIREITQATREDRAKRAPSLEQR